MMPLVALAVAVAAMLAPATGQPAQVPVAEIGAAPSVAVDIADAPSGIPGFSVGQLESDAWQTYNGLHLEPQRAGDLDVLPSYMGSDTGSGSRAALPADYVRLESTANPGLFHVFHYVPAWHA